MGKNFHMSDGTLSEDQKQIIKQAQEGGGMAIPAPTIDLKKLAEKKAESLRELKKRRVIILKEFRKWAKNRKHVDEYNMFDPIGALVLIRVYLYEPPVKKKENVVLTSWEDDGTRQEHKAEMFPYVKILRVGSEMPDTHKHLFPGNIALIPDDMCSVEFNQEWKEWQFMKREKPSIDEDWPMPPEYIPSLTKWGKYVFKRDKFMPETTDDLYTFLIPPNMIRCDVDVELVR